MIDISERAQSRADAKYFRRLIIDRCRGCCEVCDYFCHPVMEVHHAHPVHKGGPGWPENLIGLCPNCHAVIGRLAKTKKKGDEIGLHRVGSWVEMMYSKDQMYLLGSIAFGTATFENGKWVPHDSALMVK